jgi:pilus assembly protein Flp/PilA
MTAALARFFQDCSGATALEYAIIGSVVSIALVTAAALIGTRLNGMFGDVAGYIE